MSQLNERAGSKALERHLFKDQVVFVAINCNRVCSPEVARVAARWPHVQHFWTDEKGVRAMKIQFVPNRLLIGQKFRVAKWWDGTHGKVVDGKHGKSRKNQSSDIADEIALLLDEPQK